MRLFSLALAILLCALFGSAASAADGAPMAEGPLKAGEVLYQSGDVKMKGYIAYDPSIKGVRPGVLVVHEWWGHNEYARKRARQLARMGYTAMAIDMYGDGKSADHPDDAGRFAKEALSNLPAAEARFMAAMKLLKENPTVDPGRMAAIGYCFGGAVVLHMARIGTDLDLVASFHGSLASMHRPTPGEVKARVLVFHGSDDNLIPKEQIDAFMKEMRSAGADFSFTVLNGAKHSFTNPDADRYAERFNMPLKYDAQADERSWAAFSEALKKAFR